MTPSALTMRKRKYFSGSGGYFLLLLLLLMNVLGGGVIRSFPETLSPDAKVFVQVSGHVKNPGVYGFGQTPCLAELVDGAGGLMPSGSMDMPRSDMPVAPGSRVNVKRPVKQVLFTSQNMSPFYRVTLGIPISINRDPAPALTAVPGIGPKTAAAIVSARERAGGFAKLTDLLSIRGINASLYGKISPYLTL